MGKLAFAIGTMAMALCGCVNASYELPRLTSDAAKDVVTEEFRDTAYSGCLKRWEL